MCRHAGMLNCVGCLAAVSIIVSQMGELFGTLIDFVKKPDSR